MFRISSIPCAAVVVAALVATRTVAAAAQGPSWCTTDALKGHVFQGCGIAATRDESVRQAYGEVARLLESRVEVQARTAQGANVAGPGTQLHDRQARAHNTTSYDSTVYEVRLQSNVALHGLKQRQVSSRGRFYTLVTYDAAPDLDRIDAALLEANAALMQGELASAVVACRRVLALDDSLPWLAGLSASTPDCANIHDVLDARVHVALLDGGAARITFDEAPVAGAFLVAARGTSGPVLRGIGPSTASGLVELPPAETFGASTRLVAERELLDLDWSRLGIPMIPFRARASRRLGTSDIDLAAVVEVDDDPMLRRTATIELQSQLHVAVGIEPPLTPADSGRNWRLIVGGSLRDVAPVFGGECAASASMRWTVIDARSGRQIAAGAVVDQRGTAGDEVAAREAAVRLAVRRVVSEVERLAKKE